VGGTCSTHSGAERCLKGFGWMPECKRPLRRPRRRWEDNIKSYIREIWIDWGELVSAGSG
jgi:hypothetical protein